MIDFNVRYSPTDLRQIITDLPRYLKGPMVEAASIYLVGDGTRGLKHYVQYRYVTRRSAYGTTFVSDRQRRFVMAMIRSGVFLPGYPRRTGNTQRAWVILHQGVRSRIMNPTAGAFYTVGDPGQSRHEEMVGWRRFGLIIASNEHGMIQAADREAQRIIREKGL
jgi:hypothetical protein